jgi:DNA-binding transcriptional MerR regulator
MSVMPLARDDDDQAARVKPKKAPTAFRTISEVADDLHIPQHVLRFWETKFTQVKPLKRGGGRRYYRPDDITLLRRISHLLYTQGYTIKGVQRLLREGGGRLADDIPPPLMDEHDAESDRESEELMLGEHHSAQPDLPIDPPLPATRLPLRFIPRAAALQAGSEHMRSGPSEAEQEAARLRQAMMEMLKGLEELRRLLLR